MLAAQFLPGFRYFRVEFACFAEAQRVFTANYWSGNVRKLKDAGERARLLSNSTVPQPERQLEYA